MEARGPVKLADVEAAQRRSSPSRNGSPKRAPSASAARERRNLSKTSPRRPPPAPKCGRAPDSEIHAAARGHADRDGPRGSAGGSLQGGLPAGARRGPGGGPRRGAARRSSGSPDVPRSGEARSKRSMQEVERELLTLAMALARQIVRRELKSRPDPDHRHRPRSHRRAAGRARATCGSICIRRTPAVVRENLAPPRPDRAWTIVEDPVIARGGCRITDRHVAGRRAPGDAARRHLERTAGHRRQPPRAADPDVNTAAAARPAAAVGTDAGERARAHRRRRRRSSWRAR